MTTFAYGKHALADCDVCGATHPYRSLREVIVRREPTGVRACSDCWDPDHPQNEQGMYPVIDPQALRNARPDLGLTASRDTQWGWNPVGGARGYDAGLTPNDLVAEGQVGSVTVTTT